MNTEQIARLAYEVNRAYWQSRGDNKRQAWEDAPQWERDFALMGVNLFIDNPMSSISEIHQRWVEKKLDRCQGYRLVTGRDPRHDFPIVPFDKVPVATQAEDFIFRAIVNELAQNIKDDNNLPEDNATDWRLKA